jgi:hypothetical protein
VRRGAARVRRERERLSEESFGSRETWDHVREQRIGLGIPWDHVGGDPAALAVECGLLAVEWDPVRIVRAGLAMRATELAMRWDHVRMVRDHVGMQGTVLAVDRGGEAVEGRVVGVAGGVVAVGGAMVGRQWSGLALRAGTSGIARRLHRGGRRRARSCPSSVTRAARAIIPHDRLPGFICTVCAAPHDDIPLCFIAPAPVYAGAISEAQLGERVLVRRDNPAESRGWKSLTLKE